MTKSDSQGQTDQGENPRGRTAARLRKFSAGAVGLLLAIVVAGLVFTGCSFIVVHMFAEDFGGRAYIGATGDEPVRYVVTSEPTAHPDDFFNASKTSGVTAAVEISGECYDLDFYLLILDGEVDRELHRRDLRDQPVCRGDRLLWNGEDLVKLDDGLVFGLFKDAWPDDLYVAPFWVGSTADEPVLVEHGIHRRSGFEVHGEGPVDGVTQFTPGSICEPDGFLRTSPAYVVRVRDAQTGELLGEAWPSKDICGRPRLLWDGERLRVLERGERLTRLPDDLYEE